jgi:ATP-dependent Clp protease ATP-binding subunit ClpA
LTSNLGAEDMQANTLGFVEGSTHDGEVDIKNFFSPEFRNRLDAVLRFKPLQKETMDSIVDKFIGQLEKQIADKGIALRLDGTAKQQLIEEGFDAKMGARPLQRVINARIKLPLSKQILFKSLSDVALTISYDKEKDEFIIGE